MKPLGLSVVAALAVTLAACSALVTPDAAPTDLPAAAEIAPVTPPGEPGGPAADMKRMDEQGTIVIEITPLNLDDPGDTLTFDVVMDTHSVDLTMDLAPLATLVSNTGATVRASLWDAPRGGHHLTGKLVFPSAAQGVSLLQGATRLTLTIINLDAPVRSFEWDLN